MFTKNTQSLFTTDLVEEMMKNMEKMTDMKYPFYNVFTDTTSGKSFLEIACAGFKKDAIDVKLEGGKLIVTAKNDIVESVVEYSHKGISTKSFKVNFDLVPGTIVTGASYEDGILKVEFEKEEAKATNIEVR